MIDNTIDTPQRTRGRVNPIAVATWPPSTLDIVDGRLASGTGVHLTRTKKRRIMGGELTNYMHQDWCSDCIGDKVFKTMYI